jgi:Mn-dependent DtxR family transcriptional regulator
MSPAPQQRPLTWRQADLLSALRDYEVQRRAPTIDDLAGYLGSRPSAIRARVRGLQDRGLVERGQLRLTPRGEQEWRRVRGRESTRLRHTPGGAS